jgi:hypothetical protein
LLGKQVSDLNDKKVEKISGADVMVVNVKNGSGISNKSVIDLAKKWGVNYLIPVGGDGADVDLKKFKDDADCEGLEPIESLKVDKDDLPDGMEVVFLM